MQASTLKRLEENKWPCIALGKVHSQAKIREVRAWLREHTGGDYRVKLIRETTQHSVSKKRSQRTIATLYRFEQEEDCFLFKLAWCDYE